MKKYLINGRFASRKVSGEERYAWGMIEKLDEIAPKDMFVLALPKGSESIDSIKNIKQVNFGLKNDRLWEQISLPIYAKKEGFIPLSFCDISPVLYPGVVCIHDAMVKAYPENFNKKFSLWHNFQCNNAGKHATAIITVSNFSKKELGKYYSIDQNKIYVINSTWQRRTAIKTDESILVKHGLEKSKYYYALGSIKPNKNIKWIIDQAINDKDELFVISGDVNNKVFNNISCREIPSNVIFTGYVTDAEAACLYQNCKAFLFPSIYEGFGLPPLEAIAYGANSVIVSDIEVLHEIYGNSVMYIDTNDNKQSIKNILLKPVDRKILDKYSWTKSAKELIELLNEIE